ncbi:hypothetical protein [Neobacillus massiliamazoniensis]|uniref:Uncharacterized protein n=1 Tax=Neobacillus massiliamazoniensis TaxID=1499688 RepID=A0A0U1NYG1_9BACI|nr:hypothetical protein [Neobacillus massiliamazoniensis]CRK83007.1 hypothetical protein BN000_02962 [Neobacillus massiliamazoniensis]
MAFIEINLHHKILNPTRVINTNQIADINARENRILKNWHGTVIHLTSGEILEVEETQEVLMKMIQKAEQTGEIVKSNAGKFSGIKLENQRIEKTDAEKKMEKFVKKEVEKRLEEEREKKFLQARSEGKGFFKSLFASRK